MPQKTKIQEWESLWAHYVAKLSKVDETTKNLLNRPLRCLNASERALHRAGRALLDFDAAHGQEPLVCYAHANIENANLLRRPS